MSKDNFFLVFLTIVIILAWGAVPALAVIGDLPAGVTALIINFSSLLTVAFLLSIGVFDRFNIKNADKPKEEWQKTWAAFRNYDLKTYLKTNV